MKASSVSQFIITFIKRYDRVYTWFQTMAENIPRENPKNADDFLDETEIITRMLHVLHKFSYDLEKLIGDKSWWLGFNSLEVTAILTSIEHEFHMVFEDRVFENFDNLN